MLKQYNYIKQTAYDLLNNGTYINKKKIREDVYPVKFRNRNSGICKFIYRDAFNQIIDQSFHGFIFHGFIIFYLKY